MGQRLVGVFFFLFLFVLDRSVFSFSARTMVLELTKKKGYVAVGVPGSHYLFLFRNQELLRWQAKDIKRQSYV